MALPIARNLLTLSGRTKLEDYEIRCLKKLLEKHTPNRIEREIESRARDFEKRGRNMKSLKANYIYKILMGQPATYHPEATDKVPSKRHQKAAKSAVRTNGGQVGIEECVSTNEGEYVADEPVELAMPLAEAEQVIAEYEAEQKPKTSIPAALLELYEEIRERKGNITFEEYLRLKFPDANEDELRMHPYGQQRDYDSAYEVDMACALCDNPEQCKLPYNCRKGDCKPLINLRTDKWTGKRYLFAGWGGCLKCKHEGAVQQRYSPKVESMIKNSGLTERQAEHTFEKYQCGADELTVTKAKAILAAKSGRNLILAGKTGTGKTHLATAIALEVMKQEKQTIFTTLSEMLGVIAQASSNNTDLFGTKMKYQSVPLLVLDDWDKAHMTDARLGYLFDILDYRYNHGLQTVVTTNAYDMGEMEFRWYAGKAEPLVSRLLENGDIITIRQASNYRLKGHFCTPKRETAVQPAKPIELKPEPVAEPEYEDEPDDYEGQAEPEGYSYAERRRDRVNANGEERSCDVFRSISEILGMGNEPETSEKFTAPHTEAEWADLLDDGGMVDYSEEERNELLFGTAHPEEYAKKPSEKLAEPETEAASGNFSLTSPDEADLRLYGGLYSD